MARQITIITPEDIPLTLEPAGLATRFGALLVDLFLQGCVLFVGLLIWLAITAALAPTSSSGASVGNTFNAILVAIFILLGFAVISGYFILFEQIWNGQTPGKRAFNLRVVRDNGAPVDFGAVAARNLVRVADMLPVSYTVGALTIFFNPSYKRLGDIVAGTVVIKEQAGNNLPTFLKGRDALGTPVDRNVLPEGTHNPLDVLTADELSLLHQFASRRWQMTSDDSERLAYRLVAPLVPRLNITFVPGAVPKYADMVSALVAIADEREAERERVAYTR